MAIILSGHPAIPGRARGPVMAAGEPLSFWGGYDHQTGEIIDRRHPLSGQKACGVILGLPYTRGSSTTTSVLLEAIRAGTAPAAILSTAPDPFLALASIVAGEMYGKVIPLVVLEEEDFRRLDCGQIALVHPDGRVELLADE